MRKIDPRERHPLEVGLPDHQMREIVSAQHASLLNQQIQHVPCCVTGVGVVLCAQNRKEALELLLKGFFAEDGKEPLQKRQQNETALTLSNIGFVLCQEQGMLFKEQKPPRPDLLAHPIHESIGQIFHNHWVQGEPVRTRFDQISPPERSQSLLHLPFRHRTDDILLQVGERDGFALNG